MTATGTHEADELLRRACDQAGIDVHGAEPIRLGENAIFRLPGGIVARIARSGQQDAARREVRIAQWLAEHDIPAVRALDDIDQPINTDGRAVTFWHELPDHHNGTPTQVAQILRRLHDLPLTEGHPFSDLDPFVRLEERIAAATSTGGLSFLRLVEHVGQDAPDGVLQAGIRHTVDDPAAVATREGCGGPRWRIRTMRAVDGQAGTRIARRLSRCVGASGYRDGHDRDLRRRRAAAAAPTGAWCLARPHSRRVAARGPGHVRCGVHRGAG
ncbi:MAG: phosphotransferase [Pseudonocardiaceae bacterium]